MELQPQVRNILPELQEVDFERSGVLVYWACVALGSQDGGATCIREEHINLCFVKNSA